MDPSSHALNFTIYVASKRPNLVEELKHLIPEAVHIHFDENNSRCFSHIVNTLITICPTEYMIFLSDKARPTEGQIQKMRELALTGKYGLVALHRFGAFCIDKDLIRKIGFFDERYVRGGFEDDDFVIRMREADVALYESEEIPLVKLPSSFDYGPPYIHFKEKWAFQPTKIIRMQNEDMPPQTYLEKIRRPENRPFSNFGKWSDSCFLVDGHHNHKKYSYSVSKFITTPIHTRLVPPPVETIPHITFLKLLASIIQPKVYVEYGVRNGTSFNAVIDATKPFETRCIGVDVSTIENKHSLGEYYQMATDHFADNIVPTLNVIVDMVFIDACHNKEQVLRDFEKIFPYVAEDGLILMHDTYPLNEMYTTSSYCDTSYLAAWEIRNSDHYKTRTELITLPVHPGLTIIRKSSRQLFWRSHPLALYDLLR